MTRTGRYEEDVHLKAGVGGESPQCAALNYLDVRHHDCCKL
jgi:hypothetical protein